ncbi:MAG TPA: glycosyltransferase [Chryseolinea sp.]
MNLFPGQRIFIVIPVHNRRVITLGCLEQLSRLGVLNWATPIVIDDGSADGTSAAVREKFPDAILLQGDGSLWWTGAIAAGMKEAMNRNGTVIIWLNDDSYPRAGTLEMLVSETLRNKCISVGQTIAPPGCYGGMTKTAFGMQTIFCPPGQKISCDSMAGNCVVIESEIVTHIGYPDSRFIPQVGADVDYGLRATSKGISILIVGDALCDNRPSDNPLSHSWLFDDQSFRERWKGVRSIKSEMYPPAKWRLYTRHWGLLGIILFALPYIKLFAYHAVKAVVPQKVLRSLFASRSATLQATKHTVKTNASSNNQS